MHHTGAGDKAFGKDDEDLIVGQGRAGLTEGGNDFFGRIVGRDGNEITKSTERFEPPDIVDVAAENETDDTLLGGHHDDAVDPGDVVADDQGRALGRNVFAAVDFDAVTDAGDNEKDDAGKKVGQDF